MKDRYNNMPSYIRWSRTAIDCYSRGCICQGCPIPEIMETPCRMKDAVRELVRTLGKPDINKIQFIEDETDEE